MQDMQELHKKIWRRTASFVVSALGIFLFHPLAPVIAIAQADPVAPLMRAYALERQDQPANAVALVRPLIESGTFQGAELGRAWILLGIAYADQSDFREAQHAYEQAISLLQPMSDRRDYASAVYSLANLYLVEGQLQASKGLRLKALQLYEQAGDHRGIARASNALASLAWKQGHIREGRRYLKQTADEMKVATELNDDDLATIFATQALFARVDGNSSAAIAGYEHAIQLLKRADEANSPRLAWEYMLLGIAYADTSRFDDALGEMRQGLSILDRAWGRKDPRYLEAEIAYSQVLDRSGDHKPAALLRATDEATLKELKRAQCIGCTISAEAFR